jgi:hypothetical protein
MPIQVTCPNGHLLACPEDRGGKQAKCPKCGSTFQVPPAGSSGSGKLGAVDLGAEVAAGSGENFWFLCPNGHKLNGPTTLQGRPGKCPHCAATFVIPSPDEVDDESADEAPLDEESFEVVDEEGAEASPAGPGPIELDLTGIESVDPALRPNVRPPTMAALFAELWRQRPAGSLVELHTRNGAVYAPDWFAHELSLGKVGLFGFQEPDGSYSLSAVNWDCVDSITVRGMDDLPTLFDAS